MSTFLRGGFLALAIHLQEAADSGDSLSAGDIRTRLSDAINDAYRGTGKWAYYIDHFGDAESGDVILSCDGDIFRCPYEITDTAGAAKCTLDMDNCQDVMPRTVYEPEVDEADHMAAMAEAQREKHYGASTPLYERFVGKAERAAAGSGDFAGKGKSFPILKPADVSAAAASLGRAGSGNYATDIIKKNIIRIAKAKGWESQLPKAWQGDGTEKPKESASGSSGLRLMESAACEPINLQESARADYEIKLIAPGKGAMAIYPAEVLKRDGSKAFPAETKIYLNHPTKVQEKESPGNRDVTRLAGVLTAPAEWKESHPKGPGLYSRMKVFADHATGIEEKAKYLAMSIYASGDQAVESSGQKKFRDGLPVLASLHEANPAKNTNSVDVVPIAGAGGLIVTEAARGAETQTQEAAMPFTEEEVRLLRESVAANSATTQTLLEAELRRQALVHGAKVYGDLEIKDSTKEYLITKVLERGVPKKGGALDTVKLTESLNAEAKEFSIAMGSGPRVTGMGAAPVVEITEAQRAAQKAAAEADDKMYQESWASLLGGDLKLAEKAVRGRQTK